MNSWEDTLDDEEGEDWYDLPVHTLPGGFYFEHDDDCLGEEDCTNPDCVCTCHCTQEDNCKCATCTNQQEGSES